ncbi:MAG: bifunctional ornithine acetyltransferase/N-acetylglutamate synthase [Promethearchaeota archaeon]|jgi:glutamate N-acetyltransferase/amino-acid N-acetyltransferase
MAVQNVGIKKINGGITSPKGFHATGNHIGIKENKKDLAIVFSEVPAIASGVFTRNVVKAAPVLWDQSLIQNQNLIQAIVINSGNANACTGEIGIDHTKLMASEVASSLGLRENQVLVASTGVIGVPLPIDIIINGIKSTHEKLGNSSEDASLAAEAIITTDTHLKEISVEFSIEDKKIRIGGMAKGSGMIHPNMATMLAFITTDVNISRELLDKAFKESVDESYNMISVDGDTSTNDSVIILANGMSKNTKINQEDKNYLIFKQALHQVNTYLAKAVVRDGEGASKFITVHVKGAASKNEAKILSKSIITSNLVKTAFFGEDANWGRIVAAMGYSGANFDPSKVSIKLFNGSNSINLMQEGTPLQFDENLAKNILKKSEITVEAILKEGTGEATAWGCDLSYDYVRINGAYRT